MGGRKLEDHGFRPGEVIHGNMTIEIAGGDVHIAPCEKFFGNLRGAMSLFLQSISPAENEYNTI